jgi:branched-chain amino acid aminotransferase
LGFPVPPSPATLRAGLDQVLEAGQLRDAAARTTVTRGIPGQRPTRAGAWIDAEPLRGRLWPGTRSGAASAIVSARPFEPGPIGRYKTTSRLAWQLAREEARAARVDEVLLVSPGGEVLEGSVSNVFVVTRGEVRTPPLAHGILPGITRAVVLSLCATLGVPAREGRVERADLERADEAFVTSSLQGVVPLATLAGRAFPTRAIGGRLREAWRREIGQTD